MSRHRPRFPLWLGPGRPPVATCRCHWGTPLLLDRPLPHPQPETRRAA